MRISLEEAEKWLDAEDSCCKEGRLDRLEWLAERLPDTDFLSFPGGWLSKRLFEEARYCFVYGQFLAASLLGFAFIERTLAALFYAAGRDDMERANVSKLIAEANTAGWVDDAERESLERIRKLRNSISHFRKPLDTGTLEYRSVTEQEEPDALTAEDACQVMQAAFDVLAHSIA